MDEPRPKASDDWQRKLTPEQYSVCRLGATESPFSGRYCSHHEPGAYMCVACRQPLFSSETKFESGTGWPSFWDAAEAGRLSLAKDTTHGMVRTEVRCSRCGSHLGHLFEDGPQPTGKRYCINSVALDFEPAASKAVTG